MNYERIGDARDKIKIEKMRKRLENHKRAVQHELDHPPFVAPKIVEPELPQLPSPGGEYTGRVQHYSIEHAVMVTFFNLLDILKL